MTKAWESFETQVKAIRALQALDALAGWDAETFMPPKAVASRGAQQAALRTVIHEKLTGPELGQAIGRLEDEKLVGRQRALFEVVKRDRRKESLIPKRLVGELAEAQVLGTEAWKKARRAGHFETFRPHLETLVKLRREEAGHLGGGDEPYDALLDRNEPGMRAKRLTGVFAELREGLVPLVRDLTARPPPDDAFLHRDVWDVETQFSFSLDLIRAMGFDLEAGRLDRSVHPFCSGQAPGDVRLTTRLLRNDGSDALFSALHEAGHGLYEQGLPDDGTPLSGGASMGLHESQSRLWENVIGRSRPFWSHFFPKLEKRFSEPLKGVTLDQWVASINRVRPSLIRVGADEVTYNLHVMVRFELELALFRGELEVRDLPGAWNEKYEKFLGIRPNGDADGVLQDIHWSFGEFGYFPTYAIGNMYAASLARAAEKAMPTLWNDIANGQLMPLREWLRASVHAVGRAKDAEEIVRDVTGHGLTSNDLLAYLRSKYTA